VEDDSMPNTPTIERVDHGMPTYTEEALAAPHADDVSTQLHPEIEQTTVEQTAPKEAEPEHAVAQDLALDPETQHIDIHPALEPTNSTLHDERHDAEYGEMSNSLEAKDMAGEMR